MPWFSGGIFPTVPVTALPPAPVAVPVHLVSPQTNPFGQQPPPAFAAQLVQPFAHLPLAVPEAGVTSAGTTIVAPLEFTMVMDEIDGQEVVSQLRPVRQQPP